MMSLNVILEAIRRKEEGGEGQREEKKPRLHIFWDTIKSAGGFISKTVIMTTEMHLKCYERSQRE